MDIIIAVVMTVLVRKIGLQSIFLVLDALPCPSQLVRGKNGMKRSDDMIDSLVRLVIESGSATGLCPSIFRSRRLLSCCFVPGSPCGDRGCCVLHCVLGE